jgi:hypothetical protein
MDKHIPWISVTRPPKSSSGRLSARTPGSMFEHCFKRNLIRLDLVFWHHNYLFANWNYSWWCERHHKRCLRWRARQVARSVVIAMAAMSVGIARVHSVCTEKQASRAVLRSDSFDILVDGGATSCMSNDLADFPTPPKDSTVRAKGFNGTTSFTKVGDMVIVGLSGSASLTVSHRAPSGSCLLSTAVSKPRI